MKLSLIITLLFGVVVSDDVKIYSLHNSDVNSSKKKDGDGDAVSTIANVNVETADLMGKCG